MTAPTPGVRPAATPADGAGARSSVLPADGARATPAARSSVPSAARVRLLPNLGPDVAHGDGETRKPEAVPVVRRWLATAHKNMAAAAPSERSAGRESHNARSIFRRARMLWPGLLPRQLAGTRGDPRRIVRLVAKRSNEAPDVLLEMLLARPGPASDR